MPRQSTKNAREGRREANTARRCAFSKCVLRVRTLLRTNPHNASLSGGADASAEGLMWYGLTTWTLCAPRKANSRGGAQTADNVFEFRTIEQAVPSTQYPVLSLQCYATDTKDLYVALPRSCYPPSMHQPFHQGVDGAAESAIHKAFCRNNLRQQPARCTNTGKTQGRCRKRLPRI